MNDSPVFLLVCRSFLLLGRSIPYSFGLGFLLSLDTFLEEN
jgi:hypothetical protein